MADKTDYAEVLRWYLEDPTRTIGDAAEEYNVNYASLRRRAAREHWTAQREEAEQESYKRAAETAIGDRAKRIAQVSKSSLKNAETLLKKVDSANVNAAARAFEAAQKIQCLVLGLNTQQFGVNGESLHKVIEIEFVGRKSRKQRS